MKAATFSYLSAILLAGLIACSNTEEPIIDEDLLGVVWRVDSLQHPDTCVVTDPRERVTIQFTADGQIKGSTGCRWFEGRYLITRAGNISIDNLIIDTSLKHCGNRLEFLASILVVTLEYITRYDLKDSKLALYDRDYLYVIYLRGE